MHGVSGNLEGSTRYRKSKQRTALTGCTREASETHTLALFGKHGGATTVVVRGTAGSECSSFIQGTFV